MNMTPKRKLGMRNPAVINRLLLVLLICLPFLPVSTAQASPWLAQSTAPTLPSAGSVLGWELNMNQTKTRQLDPRLPNAQSAPELDAPVIFYDLKYWQNDAMMKNLPFLLNTPEPR